MLQSYPTAQRDRILAALKAAALARMGKDFPEPSAAYALAQPHGSDSLDLLCPAAYQRTATERKHDDAY